MISLIIQLFAKIISRLFGIYVGEAEVCRPHLNRRCADAMPLRTIGVLYIYIYTYPDGFFVPLSKHKIDTLKRSSFIRDTIRKPCMYLRESWITISVENSDSRISFEIHDFLRKSLFRSVSFLEWFYFFWASCKTLGISPINPAMNFGHVGKGSHGPKNILRDDYHSSC